MQLKKIKGWRTWWRAEGYYFREDVGGEGGVSGDYAGGQGKEKENFQRKKMRAEEKQHELRKARKKKLC